MKKKNIIYICFIIILILIDQISKLLITKNINIDEDIILIKNFLTFTYIKNFGAAFGMFQGGRILFIIITIVVVSYLIYELIKTKNNNKLYLISFILIISGILGNFIDRLFLGYVRDFISFKIFNPVFNIADSFIVIGVILFIIYMFLGEKNGSKK